MWYKVVDVRREECLLDAHRNKRHRRVGQSHGQEKCTQANRLLESTHCEEEPPVVLFVFVVDSRRRGEKEVQGDGNEGFWQGRQKGAWKDDGGRKGRKRHEIQIKRRPVEVGRR